MRRLTARLLLLFALVGNVVPLALAATSAKPHACCLRKTAHQCHGSIDSHQLVISGMGCCHHDCCRAVTTSQSAHPRPSVEAIDSLTVVAHETESQPGHPFSELAASQSTRAPPAC